MQVLIKDKTQRLLLEKVDNGVILYDVGEDDTVSSKLLYEVYQRDGAVNFDTIIAMLSDIIAHLQVPLGEEETNTKIVIVKIPLHEEKE